MSSILCIVWESSLTLFFCMYISSIPTPFVEKTILHSIGLASLWKIHCKYKCILPNTQFYPINLCLPLVQYTKFDYYSGVIHLKSESMFSLLIFKIVVLILCLLHFHMNFMTTMSNGARKVPGILMWIMWNL